MHKLIYRNSFILTSPKIDSQLMDKIILVYEEIQAYLDKLILKNAGKNMK